MGTRRRTGMPVAGDLVGRAKRRAEQREKARRLKKARLAAKRAENPRVLRFIP